jgi:hypothetical protein
MRFGTCNARRCFLCGPRRNYITRPDSGTDRLVVGRNVTLTLLQLTPQGPTIVGTGNGTPEVPELPSAWGYSWQLSLQGL